MTHKLEKQFSHSSRDEKPDDDVKRFFHSVRHAKKPKSDDELGVRGKTASVAKAAFCNDRVFFLF